MENEEAQQIADQRSFVIGRPPVFKNAEEMQEMITGYFRGGMRTRQVRVGDVMVSVPVPTITGLVLYLGFADRSSFYDYELKDEFFYTIKKARSFIENEYEELLQTGGGSAAIFALKNFGWHDKKEVEHSGGLAAMEQKMKGFLDDPRDDDPRPKEDDIPDDHNEPEPEDTEEV